MEAQIEAATSSALLFLYGSKPIDRLPGQEAAWATATPRCHPLVITSIFLDTIYEKSAFLIFPSISL
jgi:hypothetical protein